MKFLDIKSAGAIVWDRDTLLKLQHAVEVTSTPTFVADLGRRYKRVEFTRSEAYDIIDRVAGEMVDMPSLPENREGEEP